MRCLLVLLAVLSTGLLAPAQQAAAPLVLRIELDGDAISPITARFIVRAIEEAENRGAACLVIVLDTPGGLVDATRRVVKAILHARVPVVVHVPSGGRAASAGLFITLAGHVAAMAPGSNIGAAHPVQLGGLPIGPQPEDPEGKDQPASDPMSDKIVNDTTAWARSLATLRGRNADWAERAVKESVSASATEAVAVGVVDLLATGTPDLIEKIDGRKVRLPQGEVTLGTSGAQVEALDMWWGEALLAVISSPNVAFLLLIFGFYGILFELYTPGWGVSGTLGIVCIVLAFLAMAVLPVNSVGLALIGLALAMFVAEAFVTSFGFLTIGGVACLVLGGLMLVDSPEGFMRVSLGAVLPVAFATAAVTTFLVGSVVRAHRRGAVTGSEGLVGERAVAANAFVAGPRGYTGTVRTHGELWRAASSHPVAAGDVVDVTAMEGLTLQVGDPAERAEKVTPAKARRESA